MPNIAIVDYGMGNLESVRQAFASVGVDCSISSDPCHFEDIDAMVIPGVGAFGEGMKNLEGMGMIDVIRSHAVERKKPLLGICLGMQLLVDNSEEGGMRDGLGLVGGSVRRLEPSSRAFLVPNMGWCDTVTRAGSVLFDAVPNGEPFYFVHSYYTDLADPERSVATIRYSDSDITVALEADNLFGVQFHPEKSQDYGIEVINSFAQYVAGGKK